MAARLPLIDSNIFLRHIRQDHPDHSLRSSAYIARIEAGELTVTTNELVVFETVYTLQSFYHMSKPDIAAVLLPIIALPGLKIPSKARLRRTLDWYVRYNLSFVDAYLAVLAQQQGLPELVSFDRNYDRVSGVRRVEP